VKVTPTEYFISKCRSCHNTLPSSHTQFINQPANPANNCITCHMPKSGAVDIPHVTITDHYIRVVKEPLIQIDKSGVKFKGLACLNNPNSDDITKARAWLYFYEKFDKKPANLD